jgi:hypothetical protein
MKFNDLYNRVFISEQNETEVADPSSPDFNDVEPAPLPELASTEDGTEVVPAASPANVSGYMQELLNFAKKLMDEENPEQSMLAALNKLDKDKTQPYEGIYARTGNQILQAKDLLNSIASELLKFSIQAAKS